MNEVYLPAAIRFGIPYETFWSLNPKKLLIYKKVYEEKQEEMYDLIDFLTWRNGMYQISAIQSALVPDKAQYPDKPLGSKSEEELSDPSDIAAKRFAEFAEVFNKKFREKDGDESVE